jgi:hypothetical protein
MFPLQTESTLLAQQSTRTSVPTTNLRDPRVKTDAAISSAATASVTTSTSQRLAPVLSAPVQFSGHMNKSEAVGSNVAESAVPLKTPTVSAANTCLPSHSVVTQQSPASAPGSSVSAAGNIFDRILDLVPGPTPAPRSEASSQLAVTASSTVPVTAQQPVVKEETVSRNETVNDVKKLTTPLPEETKAAAEPASTTSAVAGEARKVGKNVGLKNASKKSVEGSSLSRPLMAGRRRTSSHDKKGSGASSGKKEKESGPALKKVKQSKEVTKTTKDLKPSGLSSDLE